LIIAFEREHAKSSNQESDTESDSADDNFSVSGLSRKRRVVQSPKRRVPPSPEQPPSTQSSSFQRSSRTSGRTNANAAAGISGTPKTTFNRSRTSIRTPATPSGNRSAKVSTSSSNQSTPPRKRTRTSAPVKKSPLKSPSKNLPHSPKKKAAKVSTSSSNQSTPPRKRTRTAAPVKKLPFKSPRKNIPQSPRSLTPLSQCDNLNFTIQRIESFADLNGRKGLMVKTTEGRTKTVGVKAAAKQNADMVLDFMMEHIP
jgi:hypothetical protein